LVLAAVFCLLIFSFDQVSLKNSAVLKAGTIEFKAELEASISSAVHRTREQILLPDCLLMKSSPYPGLS